MIEYSHVLAVPGANSVIDFVHPATGLSCVNGETLEQIRLRHPEAELLLLDDYMNAKIARQNTPIEWLDSDVDTYGEQRDCLPPEAYSTDYSAFMVGEPWDHSAETGQPRFIAYRKHAGKYQRASRPMTVKEFTKLVG